MSKTTDALNRAEEERRAAQGAKFSGYFQALKQELQDEIRWVEEAVRRREPANGAAQAAIPAPAAPVVPAQPAPKIEPPAPVQTEAVVIKPQSNLSPASWDQAIALIKDQLQTCEQQSARQAGDVVRFRAQLDALESLITQLTHEREQIAQKLEQTSKTSASLEQAKASLSRQLDALRECQVLAYDVRMADQECQASAAVVAHIGQSNQRMANELAHYQDRTNSLQQQAQQLKFKLAQAMAAASTAPANAPQPKTESSS